MKKLINIFVLSSMLLFFNNVFAASVSEIKVEINTFRMLLENETITQDQWENLVDAIYYEVYNDTK